MVKKVKNVKELKILKIKVKREAASEWIQAIQIDMMHECKNVSHNALTSYAI